MKLIQRASGFNKKLLQYVKSHLWFSLISAMMLIFLLVALIFQSYLKNQYYNYLLNETWKTETAVLSAASGNLNEQLNDALKVSSEIAVNENLRDAADKAIENTSNPRNTMTLADEMNSICFSFANIVSIAIASQDGLVQEYGRYWSGTAQPGLWAEDSTGSLSQLYSDVQERLTDNDLIGRYVVSTTPAAHQDLPKIRMFHIALPLLGGDNTFQDVTAIVVVSFRLDSLMQSGSLAGGEQSYIFGYLTDLNDTIIYHENQEMIGLSETEYLSQSDTVSLSQPLNYFSWNAHIAIDTKNIENDVDRMYAQSIVVYLLLLCGCGWLWNVLLRRILRPINTIGSAMKEIHAGMPERKIEIKGSHELWQLAEQYNDMIDALHEQQDEVQRQFEEKTRSIEQKNRAEREALESQINAHFLCNTLNAINYNVIESGNNEVAALLKKLSNILYYTFSQKNQNVTLGQELDWVQQYLYLQKYRMGDRFSYEVNFPEEYREWPCCKLILQPFVENSILHGFENREQGGMIWINGQPERELFRIEIRDNGCGMTPEVSAAVQRSIQTGQSLSLDGTGTGIGIRNVITRMKMFFGEKFQVQMETAEQKGTCFTFWLPIPPVPGLDDLINDNNIEEGFS